MRPMQVVEEMFGGPGTLRFLIQPLAALALGLRDGKRDHEAGSPPFAFALLSRHRAVRETARRSGIRALMVPLVIAVTIDALLQHYVLQHIDLFASLVVGVLLVFLPYSLMRGLANRMLTASRARRKV